MVFLVVPFVPVPCMVAWVVPCMVACMVLVLVVPCMVACMVLVLVVVVVPRKPGVVPVHLVVVPCNPQVVPWVLYPMVPWVASMDGPSMQLPLCQWCIMVVTVELSRVMMS